MEQSRSIGYYFIVFASVIIVLAGIKSASAIVVPVLLSLFIAIILSPAFQYLVNKKVPSALALLVVIGIFFLLLLFFTKVLGGSIEAFRSNTDLYAKRLSDIYAQLTDFVGGMGYSADLAEVDVINAKQVMGFMSSMLHGMSSLFTNGFVVLLTTSFMLLESKEFVKKVESIEGKTKTVEQIEEVFATIKHYMLIKAAVSFVTALAIYIGLLAIGVDYPFLFAVIAFFLNFVPNIGSIIAAVPALLIALIQLGWIEMGITALLYVVVNISIGSVLEPRIMGKGLGLSTLVVFLSLLFWGWLLGIVGMLLSIPLTIMAKIFLANNTNTRWIAIMLDNGVSAKK